jgi:hypothetical protein
VAGTCRSRGLCRPPRNYQFQQKWGFQELTNFCIVGYFSCKGLTNYSKPRAIHLEIFFSFFRGNSDGGGAFSTKQEWFMPCLITGTNYLGSISTSLCRLACVQFLFPLPLVFASFLCWAT